MKVIVPNSGGKDSQASLIWAVEKYGAKNVEAVFCDTGWEHELTYKHVKLIPELLGVKLTIVKSKKYNGFVDLSVKKGRMPSTMARFCTEELKIKPMIDYILSQKDNLLIVQGIRADESESRSQMSKECTFFKYYFEPYQTNSMIVSKYEGRISLTERQQKSYDKAKLRLSKGKEDPKFHTYRKKEVIQWVNKYSDDVLRPVFYWGGQEVIMYSIDRGFPLNPLYYKGAKRVGCYPCIMCTKAEMKEIVFNDPETIDKVRAAENKACSSFFRPQYVPERYRRQIDSKGNKYCNIDDVVDYIKDSNATGDLFAEIEKEEQESSGRKCMSAYSICE